MVSFEKLTNVVLTFVDFQHSTRVTNFLHVEFVSRSIILYIKGRKQNIARGRFSNFVEATGIKYRDKFATPLSNHFLIV